MLAMTFCGSLVFSVVSVCYDTNIYNSADVRRVVGFHPVGVLLNREEFSSDILEQYVFRLSAAIDQAIRTTGSRTFVFTSVHAGGGTSSTVQALSRELATLDHKVLTILASENEEPVMYGSERPQLILESADEREMETPPEPTLEISGVSFKDYMPRSPKGPAAVARTLQNAAAKYDVVLIDAEPLMISADTEYLARNTDVTVLVVESSLTARRELSQAAQLLERIAVPGVAVVLNKVSAANADSQLRNSLRSYKKVFSGGRHSSITERTLRRREADAQQPSRDVAGPEQTDVETGTEADTVAK